MTSLVPKTEGQDLAPDDSQKVSVLVPRQATHPMRRRRRSWLSPVLFALIVLLPTAIAANYTVTNRSPLYSTEVSFAVRAAEGGSMNPLGGVAASMGIGGSDNDIYAIGSYLRSPASFERLDEQLGFVDHAIGPDLDPFTRLDADANFDSRLSYFRDSVSVQLGVVEQLITVTTWAFDPMMANQMAVALVELSEEFINNLNSRAERDIVKFAERELESARDLVRNTQLAVARWRNTLQELDPTATAASQQLLLSEMGKELVELRTQMIRLENQGITGPRLQDLRSQADALEEQMRRERLSMFEGRSSPVERMAEYERLVVEQDIAAKQYDGAYRALAAARQDAARQTKYLVVTSSPTVPQSHSFPRLTTHVPLTFCVTFVIFLIVRFLMVLSRDYRAVR